MKTYIRFEAPKSSYSPSKAGQKENIVKKFLVSFLKKIIPQANPDFDDKIVSVQYWLVECDNETGIPDRELGLNKEEQVILKMPYKRNYGYWTDNNLRLNDFKEHFMVSEISKEIFEQNWNNIT